MSKGISFDEALESTDFGLIVCGKTGRLKGVWMPEGVEDGLVPKPVADICMKYFDIDPNEDDNASTFH